MIVKHIKKLRLKGVLCSLFLAICLIYAFYLGINITRYTNVFKYSPSLLNMPSYDTQWPGYVQKKTILPFFKEKWRQTSLHEIFNKHAPRTSTSCVNVCDKNKEKECTLTSLVAWQNAILFPDFKFAPLLSDFEFIYPFEVDYLSQPPMIERNQLPSLIMSMVYIEGTDSGDVFCAIGDTLRGRVDLVDDYGIQRKMGGDDVRVWMVDMQTKKYRAAGHVTDLRNGSYQISVRCLWPGKSQVNVAVAYPREHIRVAIIHTHLGVTWFNAAKFQKGDAEEVTICSPTPNIPGRPCLCNFTSTNELSFYCGRPLDSRLECEDWIESFPLVVPEPRGVTTAEAQLAREMSSAIADHTIQCNITIVANGTGKLPPLKPCSETSPIRTWETDQQPTGFWSNSYNWQSLICEQPRMTLKWAVDCLHNSNVWIFGDSNGYRLMQAVLRITANLVGNLSWPKQYIRWDNINGIKFIFTPSEYPVFLHRQWRQRLRYGGVAKQIDKIPSSGTHFIVIHYFLHLSASHLSVAFLRWKAAHDAIQRLVARNPNVIVGIQGPHVSSIESRKSHAAFGDNLGMFLREMIQYIFADLKHKVIFLDSWEMTEALENSYFHPSDIVFQQLLRTLLAFRCHK
ncbi:hypothetical protein BsWGS_15718 [Bradybaena similaris]